MKTNVPVIERIGRLNNCSPLNEFLLVITYIHLYKIKDHWCDTALRAVGAFMKVCFNRIYLK